MREQEKRRNREKRGGKCSLAENQVGEIEKRGFKSSPMSSFSQHHCHLPFQSALTGFSTAQKNLAKILTVIVTVPPALSPTDSALGTAACPDVNDISTTPIQVAVNLNLRLGRSLDISGRSEDFKPAAEEEEGIPTAHSGVLNCANQSLTYEASSVTRISKKAPSEGECSPKAAPIKHGTREISEISNTSCKLEHEINKETKGGGGYLNLLLEAARQISSECGNDADDEPDEKASSKPHSVSGSTKRTWTTSLPEPSRSKPTKKKLSGISGSGSVQNAYDETEPIVRSRR